MASYNVHLAFMIIMAFMPSPLLSSYLQPSPKVPTLSSSPATLTDPPPSPLSPFQALSPDIAPLLPSPGGVLPTPTGSDIPIIPSNPSPPNPDDIIAPGPLSALSPFGSMPGSSGAPRSLVGSIATPVFAGLAAYWSMQYMRLHFAYSWKPRSDGNEELLPSLSGLHAKEELIKIRGTIDIEEEFKDLVAASEASKMVKHPWVSLLKRQYRPQLTMAISIPFFQQLTGMNVITFYAPVLFKTIGFGATASLMSAMITGACNALATLVSIFTLNKFGKRTLFLRLVITIAIACKFGVDENQECCQSGWLDNKIGSTKSLRIHGSIIPELDYSFDIHTYMYILRKEFEGIANHFQNHDHIRLILKYDKSLSHSIYAASDMFIIPSIFESCGITQRHKGKARFIFRKQDLGYLRSEGKINMERQRLWDMEWEE
ncbi:hypothetical protein VNO77_01608 [Canavalia gladiata]|uniref:Uncharacterized protein n=1 Tax=Canavalia gladiata TaxID=3824 RepID=A0AAN9R5D9_CANGL